MTKLFWRGLLFKGEATAVVSVPGGTLELAMVRGSYGYRARLRDHSDNIEGLAFSNDAREALEKCRQQRIEVLRLELVSWERMAP